MRDGRWKFLVNPDGSEAQLIDLDDDEGESRNLLTEHPGRAANMAAQIAVWANDLGFDFNTDATLAVPTPTIAILTSNQLLRFQNHGVAGDRNEMQFDGKSWLDLPAFRAPKVAGGRSLQIKGTVQSESPTGVIFAHGNHENGYCIYVQDARLCFVACVDNSRSVVQSSNEITGSTIFEANWNPRGEMFLKVNGKLSGKATPGILPEEPTESIQIGADVTLPVGDYQSPNRFSGSIENLTFRYPNGT